MKMKTLKEIYNEIYIDSLTPILVNGKLKAYSDKNTNHSYIDHLYENLFKDIRHSATKILEIGIFAGGSILLWKEYFHNAQIYGLDISYYKKEFEFDNRVTQIIGNAYSKSIVDIFNNDLFDVVIDDGPHTLKSFQFFIQHYWNKVKPGGYLIIEDIFDPTLIPSLLNYLPSSATSIEVCDFRHVKNLFDDVVLVLKK
jgi:SAM-dependent methyltransferase